MRIIAKNNEIEAGEDFKIVWELVIASRLSGRSEQAIEKVAQIPVTNQELPVIRHLSITTARIDAEKKKNNFGF